LGQNCVLASLVMTTLFPFTVAEKFGPDAVGRTDGAVVLLLSEHAANTSAPAATAREENVVTIRRIHTPMGEGGSNHDRFFQRRSFARNQPFLQNSVPWPTNPCHGFHHFQNAFTAKRIQALYLFLILL